MVMSCPVSGLSTAVGPWRERFCFWQFCLAVSPAVLAAAAVLSCGRGGVAELGDSLSLFRIYRLGPWTARSACATELVWTGGL